MSGMDKPQTASDLVDRSRSIISTIASLSLGARLAIGALLGALGSSTVLGFLAEYATFNYALVNGVRLPTEGVPFLRFTVTIVSLTFMVIALGSFGFLFLMMKELIKLAMNSSVNFLRKDGADIRTLPIWKYAFFALPGALLSTQFVSQMYGSLTIFFPEQMKQLSPYALLGTFIGWMIVILILGRRPEWTKWFVTLFFVSCVMGIIVAMFNPEIYGKLLSAIRFGGGVDFQVKRDCKDRDGCAAVAQGKLFLRTENYFIFLDEKTNRVTEIPTKEVFEYGYVGLR